MDEERTAAQFAPEVRVRDSGLRVCRTRFFIEYIQRIRAAPFVGRNKNDSNNYSSNSSSSLEDGAPPRRWSPPPGIARINKLNISQRNLTVPSLEPTARQAPPSASEAPPPPPTPRPRAPASGSKNARLRGGRLSSSAREICAQWGGGRVGDELEGGCPEWNKV